MHETCRKEGVLMPVNVNEIEPDKKIVEIEMERLREFRIISEWPVNSAKSRKRIFIVHRYGQAVCH